MTAIRLHMAKPEHEMVFQDLVKLLERHNGLPKLEILAIAANMVGKLVAMQDQRTVTPDMAMEIVAANVEEGNRQIIEKLAHGSGARG